MSAIYLYAIIDATQRFEFGCLGLPDGQARVTAMPEGRFAAVISEYRGEALTSLPKPELVRCLTIHQRVIECAMAEQRVLPAKFGTLLGSRAAVRTVLHHFRHRLHSAFERLGDTIEIEVAATCDLGRTFAEIGREPEIAALATSVASAAGRPDEDVLSMRVQVGQLVKEALDLRRREYRERIMRDLAHLVVDSQPNLLLSDEMVANVAFLIERCKREEFYDQVHRLDQAFEGRLNFRCIGPLPPYSFATVTLVQPCTDEIEAACRLLHLGERASETEINIAYRRLAALCHPDHNAGDASSAERFATLGRAHTQLLAYLRGRNTGEGTEAGAGMVPYSLSASAIKKVPLLTVTRSNPESVPHMEPSRERDTVAV